MVDDEVDSVFFSLELVTRNALEKVRGVDKLRRSRLPFSGCCRLVAKGTFRASA